jgi:hypothetical protein
VEAFCRLDTPIQMPSEYTCRPTSFACLHSTVLREPENSVRFE